MHLEMPQENQTRKWTLNSIFLYWIKKVKHIDENIFFAVQRNFLERKFEDQFLANGARIAKITENMVNFASWDQYKEHHSAD